MSVRPPRSFSAKVPTGPDVLEVEIIKEKAATLGRLADRLTRSLAKLAQAGDGAPDSVREPLLAAAAEALWHFVVQRDLCGLHQHETVLKHFNVPRAVRARMGIMPRRAIG